MKLKDLKEKLNELPNNLDDCDVVFGSVYAGMECESVDVTCGQIELGI